MRRILDFSGFLNEAFFGFYIPFIFVPVDSKFKSLDPNLSTSKTPLPSERDNSGTAGYLLVPATIDASQTIFGQYFRQKTETTKVEGLKYTKKTTDDGIIVMNGGDDYSTGKLTGVASITAEVPGFGQQPAIYLKTGNAYIAEILMKKSDWEVMEVGNIRGKKIGNGFPSNQCLGGEFFGGMDDAISGVREILAASSSDIGIQFEDPEYAKQYDVTEELLELFMSKPGDFMTLNFSEDTFNKISELAKEREPEQKISQTIDNLSDLKSGGFFDD